MLFLLIKGLTIPEAAIFRDRHYSIVILLTSQRVERKETLRIVEANILHLVTEQLFIFRQDAILHPLAEGWHCMRHWQGCFPC
ncbi:hypothetical protein HA50_24230 [Pantoea cypripedii]|uniref:Uncharacterized protein n=1 Tax=Pantoea cypripedii TaxID=55209 RepID=A0A1X1ELJ7_PANCY|nr:hypothetical protein HA50_24230 [Pantoea cypripedii]